MKWFIILFFLVLGFKCYPTTYKVSPTDIYAYFKAISEVNAYNFSPGDQILFQRGSTFYGSLTVKNSGTAANPITYGTYGTGEKPVITGFTTVTGWTSEGGGIYSKVITSEGATNMVIVDGVQCAIGRYPNNSFLTYEACNTNVSITDNELQSSPNWTGAEVVIKKNGFNIDRCLITNHTGNVLTYTNLGGTGNATAGYGYFIQNDIRTLDQFGEWYHDVVTGKFYMYFGAANPNSHVIKVATINKIITNTSGYDYIIIDGISISGSIYSAIDFITSSDNCSIRNCYIAFSGIDGIRLTGSSETIDSNIISNCNVGGIAIGASGKTNNIVSNNQITNCNLLDGQKKANDSGFSFPSGILAAYGECLIQYNRIENVGYNGMHLGGNNVLVKNNFINNCMLRLNDGGAIYTNGNHTNFVIDGNIITNAIGNIEGTTLTYANLASDGADGIYLDELCNGVTVQNNSISGCYGSGIKLHKAHDNNILSNTTLDCARGLLLLNFTTTNYLYANIITGNKFISKTITQLPLKYRSSTDEIASFGNTNNNVYARPISDLTPIYAYQPSLGSAQNYSLSQWKTFSSQDANSLGSPIAVSSDDDIYFYYNDTKTTKTIEIAQNGIDITGDSKVNKITLQPFTSVVILRDSSKGTIYYVNSSGNDTNSGISEQLPIATLAKVNSLSNQPNDVIRFKKGDSWFGQLVPQSGTSSGYVTYSSYGTGEKPLLHMAVDLSYTSKWTNETGNIWTNVYTYGNELITNSSFAADVTTEWTQTAYNSGAVTRTRSTTEYHTSNGSMQCAVTNQGTSWDAIKIQSNSMAFEAGKYYEFSFWAKSTKAFTHDQLIYPTNVSVVDIPVGYVVPQITTSWAQYKTYLYCATSGSSAMQIYFGGANGPTTGNTLYFDDISIKEVPDYLIPSVGNVLLNNSFAGVQKYAQNELTSQGQYWNDTSNKLLKIYSVGNPATYYSNIKALLDKNIIPIDAKDYVTIDGLALKYSGTSAIGDATGGSDYITLNNLDVAWIGGKIFNPTTHIRAGNGIGFWNNCSNIKITNCKVWECFDAGISHQAIGNNVTQNNISIKNNSIWNCEYSYEYFNSGSTTTTSNVFFENNTCSNAGGGWGHSQRPDPSGYHVRIAEQPTITTNFIIRGNVFSSSTAEVIHNWSTTYSNYKINSNVYFQPTGNLIGIAFTYYYTPAQFSNYKSVTGWDKHSILKNTNPIKDINGIPTKSVYFTLNKKLYAL